MKINEFANLPQNFLATVRVVISGCSSTVRTTINADGYTQARAMLTRLYGEGNVMAITQAISEGEEVTEGTKTLSPQELQVKSLADKAKDYKQQEKALKARQQMAKAQQNLMKAQRNSPS